MNPMKKIVEVIIQAKLIIIISLIIKVVRVIKPLEKHQGMKFLTDYIEQKKKKLLMKK